MADDADGAGNPFKDAKSRATTAHPVVDFKHWVIRQFGGGKRHLVSSKPGEAATDRAVTFTEPSCMATGPNEFGCLVADRGWLRSVGGTNAPCAVLLGTGKEEPNAKQDDSGGAMPSASFVFRGPVRAMCCFVPTSEDWSMHPVVFFTDGGNQIWALQLTPDEANRPVKAYGLPVGNDPAGAYITGLVCDAKCNIFVSTKKGAHIYKIAAPADKESLQALIPGGSPSGEATVFSGAARNNKANAAEKQLDGSAKEATFHSPAGMCMTADGTGFYVADSGYHTIRRVDVSTGAVSTVSGRDGPNHVDGAMNTAQFNEPVGVAIGRAQQIFVADAKNFRIRCIDLTKKEVSTVMGSGFRMGTNTELAEAWNYAIGEVRSVAVTPTNQHIWTCSGSTLVAEALPPIRDDDDTGCRMCGQGDCTIM